jgi:ribosomal protein S18 acetylase RimI-like enzyme
MTVIRQLTRNDYREVLAMQTGIEDDYVIRLFPQLIENPAQTLYGLETEGKLAAVAGVVRMPNGNGILGRLRSDIRYQSNGNATALLQRIIADCEQDLNMHWVGAITQKSNIPAQRVLDKLGLQQADQFISLLMESPDMTLAAGAQPWQQITDNDAKRDAIEQAVLETQRAFYPYEAYFPIPFASAVLEETYLEKLAVFQDPNSSKMMALQEDYKGRDLAQIQYFWPDLFEQDGLWAAVFDYIKQSDKPFTPQVDVSPETVSSMPDAFKSCFTANDDPWLIYGTSI